MKDISKLLGILALGILLQACNEEVKVDGGSSGTITQGATQPSSPNMPELLLSDNDKTQANWISTSGSKGAEQDFYFELKPTATTDLDLAEMNELATGCNTREVTKSYLWLTMKDDNTAENAETLQPGLEFRALAGKRYVLYVSVTNLRKCTNYQVNLIATQL